MSFKTTAVLIDGIKTDIAISEYVDSYFIALTQFEKLGAIVSVKRDSFEGVEEERTVYTIKTVLGDEEGPAPVVARYLTEQLGISKPTVFCVSLRDSGQSTLRALAQVLHEIRRW